MKKNPKIHKLLLLSHIQDSRINDVEKEELRTSEEKIPGSKSQSKNNCNENDNISRFSTSSANLLTTNLKTRPL